MKKIVGIIAVAAIFATSVFASDISAATKIAGKIFAQDAAKTMTLFTEKNDSHDYANPNFSVSISDDNFGASLKITTDGDGGCAVNPFWAPVTKQTTQTIWFKPVDALKITAGNYDVALNKEQIDWTQSVTGLGGNGFLFSVNASGLGIDFGLSQANGANWFSKADGADPVIKSFFVKFGYAADFGNIGAYAEFNRMGDGRRTYAWHDALFGLGDTPVAGMAAKDGAVKDIHFGAGYRNNFGGVDTFLNVAGFMADKFEWIRPEIYAAGSADAFGYALFVAPVIFTDSDLNQDAQCELTVKLSYAMDGFTPYFYFNDVNLMAETFAATIKIGANGNLGGMGWNTWIQLDVADKTAFSVPFELTIGF